MAFAMLAALAACGGGGASVTTTTAAPAATTTTAAATTAAATTAAATTEAAAKGPYAGLDPVQLIWYFRGTFPQPDQDMVFEEVNKMLTDYMNTTVDFRAISGGDYEQKMTLVISSGDEYDICFTSNWVNNYGINVGKGAYMDITDLLPQYAPNTFSSVTPAFWDATRVNDRIYAVICEQISARISAVSFRETDIEKYDYDYQKDYELGNIRSLEPLLEQIKADRPERYFGMALDVAQEYLGMEYLNGVQTPGGIDCFSGDTKIFNQFKSETFMKWVNDMRYFNEKGYMDAARRITMSADATDDSRLNGSVGVGGAYKPGGAEFDSLNSGFTIFQIPSNKPILTTGGIVATMQALNRESKNPERALMLLEVLNYNTESGTPFNRFYNTLVFGIQGTHWDTDGTFRIPTDAGRERYNNNCEWMFASNYQAIPLQGQPADVWEQTKKVNASALVSPLCGFMFDVEPVKGEAGACSAIVQEYMRPMELGAITESEYNEFLKRLDDAGAETVMAEMQRQVDEWLAK
jgi:putative aldouronate transport system substrate-binding protein